MAGTTHCVYSCSLKWKLTLCLINYLSRQEDALAVLTSELDGSVELYTSVASPPTKEPLVPTV